MRLKKHLSKSFVALFVTCFLAQNIWAQSAEILVKEIKFTEKNNLEILVSQKSDFKIFTLTNPDRLVVDIANAKLEKPDEENSFPSFVTSFRSRIGESSLRLVFDLNQKATVQKTKFEKDSKQVLGKISAEISGLKNVEKTSNLPKPNQDFILSKVAEFDVETTKINNPDGTSKFLVKKIPKVPTEILSQKTSNFSKKLPTIVIDSGHGGKDPGTIGTFARTKEKNITLSYAKELGKELIRTNRYRVFLTRSDDKFIPLRERVEIARKKKADLFISIHANATSDKETEGFSIYTLSETSSDKQAELLAQKENRADIINGMNFSGASQDIVKTLIDLSQRESKNSSALFAKSTIESIKHSQINLLQNTHRFAGFAVLTAPDMASVLIELGYLSNKKEEALLNSLFYKRKVASSLAQAIDEYFSKNKS